MAAPRGRTRRDAATGACQASLHPAARAPAPMKGPAMLLGGIVLFSLLDANTKLLSGQYSAGQVLFMRYAALLGVFLLARAIRPGLGGEVTTRRPGLHLLRACSMMVSAISFFMAFRRLPLAEGYLVFFTAPLATLVLAALLLREAVPRAAWFWTLAGFAGVLLSILPRLGGGEGPAIGYFWVTLGTLAFAINQTINRSLRQEAGPARILLWPSLLGLAVYGPPAALHWVAAPAMDLARLAANGVVAGAAIALTAAAFRHADAARLGPYGFAALPVSVGLDLAIWGHPPDLATILGGMVVVGACLMSERARRRGLLPLPAAPGARSSVAEAGRKDMRPVRVQRQPGD